MSAVAALVVAAGIAEAASPEGPRLAFIAQEYGRELITIGPQGDDLRAIVGTEVVGPGVHPSWSADGSRMAFSADVYPDDDPVLGAVDADGGNLRIYPDVRVELGDPVMAPDGRSAAFAQVRVRRVGPGKKTLLIQTALWSFDFQKQAARQLTRWRGGFLAATSYSPDGSTLAVTAFDFRRFKAVAIDLDSGRTSLLARNAAEPVYSPDGSSIAFIRRKPWLPTGAEKEASPVAELRVGRVGVPVGSRSLLRVHGLLSPPSWDPSGQRLAFAYSRPDGLGEGGFRKGDRLMAINADGTCLTKVFSDPELALYGASWQPGPGREAGPIAC